MLFVHLLHSLAACNMQMTCLALTWYRVDCSVTACDWLDRCRNSLWLLKHAKLNYFSSAPVLMTTLLMMTTTTTTTTAAAAAITIAIIPIINIVMMVVTITTTFGACSSNPRCVWQQPGVVQTSCNNQLATWLSAVYTIPEIWAAGVTILYSLAMSTNIHASSMPNESWS